MKRLGRVILLLFLITVVFHSTCIIALPEHLLSDIVVFGDTRTNHDKHREIVNAIVALKPPVVFHSGDLVADGRVQSQWDTFNSIAAPLLDIADFYAALGNHEHNSDLYYQNFDFPGNERWYSVDVMNVHFIILDSCNGIEIGSTQYDWLESDLAKTVRHRRHSLIAVIFHHPPYSTGKHIEDEKGLRTTIVPLFEKYGVDIVFNGHDHCYARALVNGIYYVVTGGGGAPLYDQVRTRDWSQVYLKEYHFCSLIIHHKKIVVDVYDDSHNVLDHFTVYDSNRTLPADKENEPALPPVK